MAEAPTTPTTTSTPSGPTPAEAVNLLYPTSPAGGAALTGTPLSAAAPATEGASSQTPTPDPAPAEGEATTTEPESLIAPKAEASPEERTEPKPEAEPAAAFTADSYEITLPDTVTLDPALMGEAKATFAKLGLDPAAAQPLADFYVRALTAQTEANVAAWNKQNDDFRTALHALPEFASTAKRQEAQTMIGRLLDDYGSPELSTVLFNAGLGNNPEIASTFLKIAKVLTEGAPSPSGGPVPQTNNGRIPKNATPGQILYESGGPGSQP